MAAPVHAAANLTIAPLTWNVIGLDSNNVHVGPDSFPVGARVCNVGNASATNVPITGLPCSSFNGWLVSTSRCCCMATLPCTIRPTGVKMSVIAKTSS